MSTIAATVLQYKIVPTEKGARVIDTSGAREPALGNPTAEGDCLTSTIAGARSWATRLTKAAADLLYAGLTHATRHATGGADALIYSDIGADQAGAAAARIPLSLATLAGDRLRATGANAWAAVACKADLGNLTGSAAPALVPGSTHTATVTGDITSWTITGLEDGESASIILTNTNPYAIATSGLTPWKETADALKNVAADGIELIIKRRGSAYYAIC